MKTSRERREPSPQGRELKQIRVDRLDYSQDEMAKALNIRLRRLQAYESGETQKVPGALMDRARALKRKNGT